MALRPDILLQGRVPDISNTIPNALLTFQRAKALKTQSEEAPVRNRLLEAQAGTAEQGQIQATQENRIRSVATEALELLPIVNTNDIDAVRARLLQRKTQLVQDGAPNTEDTDEALALLDQPGGLELLKAELDNVVSVGQRLGVIESPTKGQTGAQKDFAEFQRLSAIAEETGNPEDITAAQQFGQKANISRATPQELADIDVTKAGDIAQARADVELSTTGKIEGTKAAAKAAINRSEKAFDSVGKIKTNVLNIDEAISLIDQGAESGVIQSKLPSVRAASVALDNLQGRLGLDVIGNTTFGALSESELAFALKTALPTNLSPPDLRRWLVRKKDAQLKLAGYLEEVASFLGTPGNTTKDFIELQKVRQLEAENPQVNDNTFTSKSGITFKVN